MSIEEMLKYLGVRTQSKESIELCYQMDIEAFNMMSTDTEKFHGERFKFQCVYLILLDTLGYSELSIEMKKPLLMTIDTISLEEEDKDYRDLYFTGLERTLLRYGHYDLVGFQRIAESDHDGIAKDAYLYEQRKNYDMAMKYYNLIGETERYEICLGKSTK